MLYNVLLIIQIAVSVAIIALVLMQHGKGADAGAAFGSGASGTVFGAQGASNFLSRTTAILAAVFFSNALFLGFLVSGKTIKTTSSIMDSMAPAPVVGTAPTVAPPTGDVPAAPKQGASDVPAQKASTGDVPAAPPAANAKPAEKPAAASGSAKKGAVSASDKPVSSEKDVQGKKQ